MKINIKLTLILSLCLFNGLYSQSKDNYNMWFQYLMSAKLTDKSTLTALTQYRSFDLAYDTRLFLVNAYVDYEVAENIRPAAGAMFLILESYNADDSKKIRYEKRPFQQVTAEYFIGRTSISNRLRVEERFLSNPDEFEVRLRYLISVRIPFNKKGEKEKLYGILKNEIRMNVDKTEPFDSNRITAGLGIKVGKNSALELAFINQMETGKTSNYGFIGFRNSFDWRKKKQQ
ncbi:MULTISPECIES: DUF2490 domain-containing protein [Chryseobacterium]|uniref:DUF2490 domain-containing protein n=1 Tax=Chryseobacterium cucumeris TaxID=1813611 RepID=A0ABX9X4Y0_9FLAO|nr:MULTISPECIES: DUF2490 domain-containing protein [Chryseobacterium]TXI86371.1 MAG: DUF2490 domain-containing protein [Chryseobacterium sp.]KYH04559.1 hypothetical protein A1704_17930 [Chryseobacterium cucumeris]QWT85409.1 DUF2490 domain-containing protein [Chryseobacterium sp. PCH239]ROH90013.1 DUF2490 domain-containing protein [Chryseobacterium cucumeris]WNI39057.1 DUF2490 domain-containing protein [Chryseobacterium sp. SG20098]